MKTARSAAEFFSERRDAFVLAPDARMLIARRLPALVTAMAAAR